MKTSTFHQFSKTWFKKFILSILKIYFFNFLTKIINFIYLQDIKISKILPSFLK